MDFRLADIRFNGGYAQNYLEIDGNLKVMVFIPNRTFLVPFDGISGEFGRAMACILARRYLATMPMVRPNGPDILSKLPKRCN